jgi:hypothetical protein
MQNQKQFAGQSAAVLLACGLVASLLPDFVAAQDLSTQAMHAAHAGAVVPLDGPVLAGKPVTFKLSGNPGKPHWDLGDGATTEGSAITHTYQKPGIYCVVMGSKVGDTFNELSSAIVRVHTPETLHLPQVLLDTDAANEIDDQHAIAYAVFSELDVLAITSTGWIKWADTGRVTPHKGLYDLGVLSFVIGEHLGRPWLQRVEPSIILAQTPYKHQCTAGPTNLNIVHQVDVAAMKKNFFDTLNGKPTALRPKRQKR